MDKFSYKHKIHFLVDFVGTMQFDLFLQSLPSTMRPIVVDYLRAVKLLW